MTLEIRDISKRVGADVHVHETSLMLLPGHFNVLLGATNAGKTTLMKLDGGARSAYLRTGLDRHC